MVSFQRRVFVTGPGDARGAWRGPGKHEAAALGALRTAWPAGTGRNVTVGSAPGRRAAQGEPRGRGRGPQGVFLRRVLLWRGL